MRQLHGLYTKLLERIGVEVAMGFERYHGRRPKDVSDERLGYDIVSEGFGDSRFIEVKATARLKPNLRLTDREFGFISGRGMIDMIGKMSHEDFNAQLKKRWIYIVVIDRNALISGRNSDMIVLYTLTSSDALKADFEPEYSDLMDYWIARFNDWSAYSKHYSIIPSQLIIKMCSILKRIIEMKEEFKELMNRRS